MKTDKRQLLIAQRIKDILHNNPMLMGLRYFNRVPDLYSDNPDWTKYGLVFVYNKIVF